MKIVGDKLGSIASLERDHFKKDLFGRSAFNRYYYAAFLVTREMLGELNPSWKRTAHREIPNLLLTGVRKPVVRKLKESVKKDLMTLGESSALQTKLTKATTELSNLLLQAYDVRSVADYEPEQQITLNNNIIALSSCKLTLANTWADKASAYCKGIRKVWKESGVA